MIIQFRKKCSFSTIDISKYKVGVISKNKQQKRGNVILIVFVNIAQVN